MNFIDSAYERLSKSAPELIKYVVSFVDMTQDLPEDSGLELGIFVIMSGAEMFYIPVLSKGGTIFPLDSIFIQSESMFFPLTQKVTDKIINTNEANLGQAVRIPPQVVKNPNVRELIEPPKTGKYMYASTGMSEFLTQLSQPSKTAFLEKLAQDVDFARGLKKLGFDVNEMKEVLSAPEHEKVASHEIVLGIKVVTEGANLPDDIVQQIMQRGYGFVGYNANPTFAVEYDARNDGYTKLGAAQPGNVYEVVMQDGTTRVGFVPPAVKSLMELPPNSNEHGTTAVAEVIMKANTPVGAKPILIMENGDFSMGSCPVIRATTLGDLVGIMSSLADAGRIVDAERFHMPVDGCGCQYMLITPTAWVGPLTINGVVHSEVGTVIRGSAWDGDRITIHVSPNLHGDLHIDGKDVYVSTKSALLALGKNVSNDVEEDVVRASRRRNLMYTNLMEPVRIGYDGLEFSVNGRRVGGEADVAKELVERKGIDKYAFEVFVDKVKEDKVLDIYMSKEAASSTGMMNDPSAFMPGMPSGPSFQPEGDTLKNRTMTGQANFENTQQAMGTGDKSIVESTIISEFVNDPNMFETISTYMPDIRESIDKLGRSIFLIRLNIGNLAATVQPEYISSLLSSLRNTYKMLGDSYMRLENLSTTPMVEQDQV